MTPTHAHNATTHFQEAVLSTDGRHVCETNKVVFEMKKKQYAKTFPVELFKRGVLVFFGTREQLREYIEKNYPCYAEEMGDDLDSLPSGSAWTFKVKDDAIIFAETIPSDGVMVHEIVHATKHLLSLVDVEDEETFCYTVEYLYERIFGWLRSISSSVDVPSA